MGAKCGLNMCVLSLSLRWYYRNNPAQFIHPEMVINMINPSFTQLPSCRSTLLTCTRQKQNCHILKLRFTALFPLPFQPGCPSIPHFSSIVASVQFLPKTGGHHGSSTCPRWPHRAGDVMHGRFSQTSETRRCFEEASVLFLTQHSYTNIMQHQNVEVLTFSLLHSVFRE